MKSYYQTAKALGCTIELCLVSNDGDAVEALFKVLWQEIGDFEKRFSRFIGKSELSLFNKNAGKRTPVSPDFKILLTKSRSLSTVTDGLFNPFVLPALQRSGYTYSLSGTSVDARTDYSNRSFASCDDIEIGDDWALIPSNTALDFGGIAKGYLADKLAAMVTSNVYGYWFSLGGDIVAGGLNEDSNPWQVNIQSHINSNKDIAVYTHHDDTSFAVASSGTLGRKGVHNGRAWHHIIDPRTQKPADSDIQLATVVSSSGIEADVLASSVIIAGFKDAEKLLHKHGIQAAFLQGLDQFNNPRILKIGTGFSQLNIKNASKSRAKV